MALIVPRKSSKLLESNSGNEEDETGKTAKKQKAKDETVKYETEKGKAKVAVEERKRKIKRVKRKADR